jgi:hypothetical protein
MEKEDKSIYQEIVEILTIFTNAVRETQEENRRLGLPNVYCIGETLFYHLPDGKNSSKMIIKGKEINEEQS